MPIANSTSVQQIATPAGGAAGPNDVNASTFQFIMGWLLLIIIMVAINKTRIGHVLIYYSLLLIILLILVTEYAQLAPLLNSIQTVGDFNQSQGA